MGRPRRRPAAAEPAPAGAPPEEEEGEGEGEGAEAGVEPDSDPVVWYGPDQLRGMLVPLDELSEDPENVNTHSDLSISEIARSYARFGQQKPVVADGRGVVRSGNGQLRAAHALGWTHLSVARSDLGGVELTLYALADNQVARRAEWDYRGLQATFRAAQEQGVAVDDLGWQPHELAPILQAQFVPPKVDGSTPGGDGPAPSMGRPVQVTQEQRTIFDAACARVREMGAGAETSEGQVLEFVSAEFLAGHGHAGGGGSDG